MKIKKYIVALLASLLVSCNSCQNEELTQDQNAIGINFTLSMNEVGVASRSLSSETISNYENRISPNDIKILAYTADGNVHEVSIMSVTLRSGTNNIYDIYGKLEGTHTVRKVVVLANCDSNFDWSTPLDNLLYTYASKNFNPEAPTAHIPMWGEIVVNKDLIPGSITHLGKITLMRAMAKISIKSTGKEIFSSVSLDGANDRGNCVPNASYVTSTPEDISVTAPTIPNGINKIGSIPFYMLNNKEAFIYLPEQNRYGKQDKLKMVFNLGGKDYTLPFMDYSEYSQGASYPVLRNTHYQYNVSVNKDAPLVDFSVVYKVVEWGKEDIGIEFN